MRLSRKEFLASTLAVIATGCGGSDEEEKKQATGCSADIVSNHGHTLTISIADVTAGQAKTYSLAGSADHAHEVIVTQTNMERLKNGESIAITSSISELREYLNHSSPRRFASSRSASSSAQMSAIVTA